jgi:ADP-ribose pyrophosphatase YjhB (NUDIX family)
MSQTASQKKRKALFNRDNVTEGGTCLSSFLVVTRGNEILVGKMKNPQVWTERFFVGEKFAPVYASSGKYVLPGSHLAWYESPLEAAARIASEQIAHPPNSKEDIKLLDVQSYVSGDPNSTTEPPHWDICFAYEMKLRPGEDVKKPEWFEKLEFVDRGKLKVEDFTRGHGEILQKLELIS